MYHSTSAIPFGVQPPNITQGTKQIIPYIPNKILMGLNPWMNPCSVSSFFDIIQVISQVKYDINKYGMIRNIEYQNKRYITSDIPNLGVCASFEVSTFLLILF